MKILIIAPVPLDGKNTQFGGGVSFSYMGIMNLLREKGHEVRYLSPWHNLEPIFFRHYPGFREISLSRANQRKIEAEITWADRVILPDSLVSLKVLKIADRLNTPTILCNHTDCFKLVSTTCRMRYGYLAALATKLFIYPMLYLKFKMLSNSATLFLTTTQENKNILEKRGLRVDGLFDNIGPKTMLFKQKDSEAEIQEIRANLLQGTKFEKIILFAGRIASEKRIPLLFNSRPENSLLVIVGEGPISDQIKKYHDPQRGVLFINKMLPQESLRKLIKATDLSVSASDFETLGMSVYESWLCGNKSVVQDAGGFRDQIKDISHGKLVDFEKPDLAKAAITEILNDKTPIAKTSALPTEKCIEEHLRAATLVPQTTCLNDIYRTLVHAVLSLFRSHQQEPCFEPISRASF